MAREFAIRIYLFVFRGLFRFFKRYSIQEKTTFVASFGGNVNMTLKKLERLKTDMQMVVLKTPECQTNFVKSGQNSRIVLTFDPKHVVEFVKSIYHLATSSHIIVDNYYGFLAVSDFKPGVTCVQLWHAAGAIKQFGLEDLTNENRSAKALERFQAVYDRFNHVVVGSEKMVEIFQRSFGLPEERFLRTGVPRSDFFFNEQKKYQAGERLREYFPIIRDKKMLLYAPTYRDGALASTKIHLDLDRMYEQFKYEYVIFLRLHPAVEGEFFNKYPGFIYNVSNYPKINDLLVGADILITDYSSIPFEFSLLNKPMIFYAYDYEQYARQRGVWDDYIERVPGPVVTNTKELIQVLRDEAFLLERIQPFAEAWNEFSKGDASEAFVRALYEVDDGVIVNSDDASDTRAKVVGAPNEAGAGVSDATKRVTVHPDGADDHDDAARISDEADQAGVDVEVPG